MSSKTEDSHIENDRKHFICITPVKSSLVSGEIPLEIFHGGKESKRTPENLTTVDVCSLCYWGLPQSLPTFILVDVAPQSPHCYISFLRPVFLLWWDLLSGTLIFAVPCSQGFRHHSTFPSMWLELPLLWVPPLSPRLQIWSVIAGAAQPLLWGPTFSSRLWLWPAVV